MKISIKRWGNSAVLPLSKELRKHLQADIGDKVDVRIIDDGLLIGVVQAQQYSLEELLLSCSRQTISFDAEDNAWLNDAPLGREI